jgi:energy-coupling factor transport system permease protein
MNDHDTDRIPANDHDIDHTPMNDHTINPDRLLENSQGAANSVIDYQSGNSFLHRLNPVTKLVLTVGLALIAFMLPGFRGPLLLMLCVIGVVIAARVYQSVLKVGLVIGIPLAAVLLVVQGLFYPGNETPFFTLGGIPIIGTITVWQEGIQFALTIVFQLLVAILAMLATIVTSHPRRLTTALMEKGMPRKLAYVFMSALQFVPRIRQRSNQIINAQQARGLDTSANIRRRVRALVDLLSPLLISELIAAQTRAIALKARGFTRSGTQTHLYDIPDTAIDRVLRWGTVVAVLVTAVGVLLGWG